MYAVVHGDADTVRDVLKEGVDIDLQHKNGWTALHFAAQSSDKTIAQLLLDAGADVTRRDRHGNIALSTAIFNYRDGPECVTVLLAAGADPDAMNNHGVSLRSLAHTIANYDAAKFFPRQ